MTHGPGHDVSEAFLGIDLGTSSVKALVVDPDGTVRGTGSAEYPVLRPQPGWAAWASLVRCTVRCFWERTSECSRPRSSGPTSDRPARRRKSPRKSGLSD